VKAYLPVIESFGFETDLRYHTQVTGVGGGGEGVVSWRRRVKISGGRTIDSVEGVYRQRNWVGEAA
jgi:hypothetical protein